MLQKVFNMFVDIPENVAIKIPGLRDPSSLPHLKRVRQKIKNKLKLARSQLKYKQEVSKKLENSFTSNDISTVSDTEIKNIERTTKNIVKSNPISLNENYSSTFSNPESFPNLKCETNKLNKKINKIETQHKSMNKNTVCTITSSNISQEKNIEIGYDKSDISPNENYLKSSKDISSTQILNRSM